MAFSKLPFPSQSASFVEAAFDPAFLLVLKLEMFASFVRSNHEGEGE
jgi:hypothetical protein